MDTAYSAAFFDPSMAMVATGMPDGICTMDRSESNPFRALLFTGMPITGNLAAFVLKGGDVIRERTGIAMGAENLLFVGYAELVEGGAARGHYVPVAGTSHDNCYFHLILRFEATKLLSICDTYNMDWH